LGEKGKGRVALIKHLIYDRVRKGAGGTSFKRYKGI